MKKHLINLVLLISWLCPLIAMSATPLPSSQAFALDSKVEHHNKVILHWQVMPQYYLYANKFQFHTESAIKVTANIPQGEFKYDKEQGREEVLTGAFVIPLSFEKTEALTLLVNYQGCSHDGFCYPPIQKKYRVNFADNIITEAEHPATNRWMSVVFDQEKIKQLLKSEHQSVVILTFFIFGLLLALTPCVLPMLPILSSIIMGDTGKRHPTRALLLSLFYVLGTASAYALIGVLAASLGQTLQVMLQKTIVVMIVSVLFLLLAAINFGWVALIFPRVWQKAVIALNHRIDGGSYLGVFAMGIVSTLIVSPCITAPLVGVLLYIAETSNKMLGATALFSMGMGLGLPLIIAGTSLNYLLPKSGPWLIAMKHSFGFIMLAMAIWLSARVLPPVIIYSLTASLLLVSACYIAFLLPRYIKKQGICLLLGVLIGSVGFYEMARMAPVWLSERTSSDMFLKVTTLSELDASLAAAKKEKIPVLIDFYADWCTSCMLMEKEVLHAPEVLTLLKEFRLLRVDLTQNTADDQAMMQRFNVIAPPSFLLFDRTGAELTSSRIVGEVDVPFFLSRLQAAI